MHIHCLTAHPPATGVVSYGELPKLDPWDSHSSKSLGRQTKAHMLNSRLDLLLECRNWEGLDDGPGWLRFALGLDAKCHPDSSLGCWLETGLDPAKAGDGEDAILLDL